MELGGRRIGVRASSERDTEMLRALLAPHVIEDQDTPTNYSLVLSDDPARLHLLYWGACLVARERRAGAILAALLRHLAGQAPAPGAVRLDAVLVADGAGRAVALRSVDRELAWRVAGARRGRLRTLNMPWVDVDPATREVIVPPLAEHDAEALRAHENGDALVQADEPERLELRGLMVPSSVVLEPPAARLMSLIQHRLPLVRGLDLHRFAAIVDVAVRPIVDTATPRLVEDVAAFLAESRRTR